MGATRPESLEADALIAPAEIRELIARLTEQSVEAVPFYEARTLEGLALETGFSVARLRSMLAEVRGRKAFTIPPTARAAFVLLALLTAWIVLHPAPAMVMAPDLSAPVAVSSPDLSGTVSLANVTYGPAAGDYAVVPNFEPRNALPKGLSIVAVVRNVLWGSGDHRAAVIQRPFTSASAETIRANVVELLEYVRDDAGRRKIPTDQYSSGEVVGTPTEQSTVTLYSYTYYYPDIMEVQLPPPDPGHDKAAAQAIERAAKLFAERIQARLKRELDLRGENGP